MTWLLGRYTNTLGLAPGAVAVPGCLGSFCSKDSLVGFVMSLATPFLSKTQTPDIAATLSFPFSLSVFRQCMIQRLLHHDITRSALASVSRDSLSSSHSSHHDTYINDSLTQHSRGTLPFYEEKKYQIKENFNWE